MYHSEVTVKDAHLDNKTMLRNRKSLKILKG